MPCRNFLQFVEGATGTARGVKLPSPEVRLQVHIAIGLERNPLRLQQRARVRPPWRGPALSIDHAVARQIEVPWSDMERPTDHAGRAGVTGHPCKGPFGEGGRKIPVQPAHVFYAGRGFRHDAHGRIFCRQQVVDAPVADDQLCQRLPDRPQEGAILIEQDQPSDLTVFNPIALGEQRGPVCDHRHACRGCIVSLLSALRQGKPYQRVVRRER